ncbi:MAG TPA: hypothetical protein VFQ85_04800 [Mycobacteriales bacterium]|nr:hypothetical protein [Mycobacteriales bacterium]
MGDDDDAVVAPPLLAVGAADFVQRAEQVDHALADLAADRVRPRRRVEVTHDVDEADGQRPGQDLRQQVDDRGRRDAGAEQDLDDGGHAVVAEPHAMERTAGEGPEQVETAHPEDGPRET